jgi:hypothetical protein
MTYSEDKVVKGPEWAEIKASVIGNTPQANLPLLEVDGQYFVESKVRIFSYYCTIYHTITLLILFVILSHYLSHYHTIPP